MSSTVSVAPPEVASRAALAPAPDVPATPSAAEPAISPMSMRFRERLRVRVGTAELLAFRIGDERFAFDVRALDEAVDALAIDPLPFEREPEGVDRAGDAQSGDAQSGGVLVGLARVSGRSIPIFDTARILGVRTARRGGQVLVMRSGSQRIGLLADDVDDVVTVDLAAVKPPPVDAGDDLLLGVTWDGEVLTGILDARALISMCQQRAGEGVA